jgi:RimJ/RimL family protein N-acetyltransferase
MIGIEYVRFGAPFTPAVEIGWRLAKEYWGSGYATEGAMAARDFAFQRLGLSELVAFTIPANLRSQAVMKKIGMAPDLNGAFEHPRLAEGHPMRPHLLYRMSR